MKKLALGALLCLAGFLAACGGGDDGTVTPIDAPGGIDGQDVCNPLAAPGSQGCATGQKCTWIEIADTPDPLGKVGCVPDGTAQLGAACTRGAVGEATGFDNCAAGLICIGSVCQDICGFDGSANAACGAGPGGVAQACTRYADLFANGDDDPIAGACNPTCDPLTQTVPLTGGGTTTCGTNKGCYLLSGTADTIAVCANQPANPQTRTHNMPINGTAYANSCAPGNMPRTAVQGQTGAECGALCKAEDVFQGTNDGASGRPDYEGGNGTVMNWNNHPATCVSEGGATVAPAVPSTGENCTFWWTREQADGITAFSNTLGWCFNFQAWTYDLDGSGPGTQTAPYPRCINLTAGDVLQPMNMTPDNLYFGCIAYPAMLRSTSQNMVKWQHRHEPAIDRVSGWR